MTVLLDSGVAIALLADDHEHHTPARRWLSDTAEPYATSPITQGALVRYVLRRGNSATGAVRSLRSLVESPRHEFWPDDIDYRDVRFDGVVGHRQVTDAYLAQLARHRQGRVATLDRGFAALHEDVVVLVPTT